MAAPVVALLTDFGDSEFAGVMKGVLAGLCPEAKLIDLCHSIGPQAVREGAWVLLTSFRYFPAGTLFVCVVDPGVGTGRRAVAVATRNYRFVGPDNGLLWPAVKADGGALEAAELVPGPGASRTFHGRDLFAPAAGRWAAGAGLAEIGRPVDPQEALAVPRRFFRRGSQGEVVRVDGFGNLVTNLPPEGAAAEPTVYAVRWMPAAGSRAGAGGRAGGWQRMAYYPTYAQAAGDEPFLIQGSAGTLEISVRNGNAAAATGIRAGQRLELRRLEGCGRGSEDGPGS